LFPELGPLVGYAVTALIRAEPAPVPGHRASTFAWWDYVLSIPAPRVVVVHDLDEPRGQGAQWGEVQANIHKALGCAGVLTDGSVRDLDEVRALGFQFAAAHVSVSHAYVHMVDFGLPVKVGGLWVKPGDLVHATPPGPPRAHIEPHGLVPDRRHARREPPPHRLRPPRPGRQRQAPGRLQPRPPRGRPPGAARPPPPRPRHRHGAFARRPHRRALRHPPPR